MTQLISVGLRCMVKLQSYANIVDSKPAESIMYKLSSF